MGTSRRVKERRTSPTPILLGLAILYCLILSFCGSASSHALSNVVRNDHPEKGGVVTNHSATSLQHRDPVFPLKRSGVSGHPAAGSYGQSANIPQQRRLQTIFSPLGSREHPVDQTQHISAGRAIANLTNLDSSRVKATLGFDPHSKVGFATQRWNKDENAPNKAQMFEMFSEVLAGTQGLDGHPLDLHPQRWTDIAYIQDENFYPTPRPGLGLKQDKATRYKATGARCTAMFSNDQRAATFVVVSTTIEHQLQVLTGVPDDDVNAERYRKSPTPARYADVIRAYNILTQHERQLYPWSIQEHLIVTSKEVDDIVHDVEALGGTVQRDTSGNYGPVDRYSFRLGSKGYYALLGSGVGYEVAWELISNQGIYSKGKWSSRWLIDKVSVIRTLRLGDPHVILEVSTINTPMMSGVLSPKQVDTSPVDSAAYQQLCQGLVAIRHKEWQLRGQPGAVPQIPHPPNMPDLMLGLTTSPAANHGPLRPERQGFSYGPGPQTPPRAGTEQGDVQHGSFTLEDIVVANAAQSLAAAGAQGQVHYDDQYILFDPNARLTPIPPGLLDQHWKPRPQTPSAQSGSSGDRMETDVSSSNEETSSSGKSSPGQGPPSSQDPSYGGKAPSGVGGSADPQHQWTNTKGKGTSQQQRRAFDFEA